MYLLDTDILSWAHAGHQRLVERIRQVGEEQVATTVITAREILRGRHAFLLTAHDGTQLLQAQRLLSSSEAMLQDIRLIPVDGGAAAEFDKLLQHKKAKKIGRGDLLIACIALANRATLVTRNLKDFQQVPGLQVENWAD